MNVIHKDIKPANLLLHTYYQDELDIRLADFGFSIYITDAKELENICGTPGYIAPEILKKEDFSYNSDIFSAGVIAYNLLTGFDLFDGRTVDKILKQNIKCDITSQLKALP